MLAKHSYAAFFSTPPAFPIASRSGKLTQTLNWGSVGQDAKASLRVTQHG